MPDQTRFEHTLALARELLDDLELNRSSGEGLLLKASRLARLVGSDEVQTWLRYEMGGYNDSEPVSVKYLGLTGRWIDREKGTAYWGPLAQQEAAVAAQQTKLQAMRVPDSSSNYANVMVNNVITSMNATANLISTLGAIRSRVLARLHSFVTQVYYELEYEARAETIFERFKGDVDSLIAVSCRDVLEKIPAVMDRLADGDSESISQALGTCRRIIEAFADAVYPPTDSTIEMDGNTLRLDASKHQNRINAFIQAHCNSKSRAKRLRQNLANLFDRVSSGVHSDVLAVEAHSLFLNTYLFVGEVLQLTSPPQG